MLLLQEFSERAAECVHMAERAKSEHDRALLIKWLAPGAG
jgi:hypothetical protein